MTQTSSPFLTPAPTASPNTLALLSLKRDQTIPTVLRAAATSSDTEEHITNTRFGSFPHSTLVNQPWGSQVVASNVGASERRRGKKRKRATNLPDDRNIDEGEDERQPAFEAAASGFAHLVPPTPESWTTSLPHRTQVVYTPDYSYVLQRLRARPGDRIIEAGAGSGSFTHAAARAVFNGYPEIENGTDVPKSQLGKVYSFEYHEPRFVALKAELNEHGLDSIVTVTHRDVYEEGFSTDDGIGEQQKVTAVFLDLPAPWQALPHLSRNAPNSPLDPERAVKLCSFSPCIEQAIRAADKMRELGWVNVNMAAMHHKRFDVRRDRIGLQEEGTRGVTAAPASVQEALARLRDLEGKTHVYHEARRKQADQLKQALTDEANGVGKPVGTSEETENINGEVSKAAAAAAVPDQASEDTTITVGAAATSTNNLPRSQERKLYKEGRLVHRTEPDLKTHTSYLVFGTLPPEWTDADEQRCANEQE